MEFYLTGIGRKFYESDVPRIAQALERIADGLSMPARFGVGELPKTGSADDLEASEHAVADVRRGLKRGAELVRAFKARASSPGEQRSTLDEVAEFLEGFSRTYGSRPKANNDH